MGEVARVRTAMGELELARALRLGFEDVRAASPTYNTVGGAWAHVALENAHGGAVWNYNLGNITTTGASGDYYTLTTQERVQRDPDVWQTRTLRYAAHPGPEQGAAAYWRLMFARYRPALDLFAAGEPSQAAYKLSELGYYTARPEAIARTMAALFDEWKARIAPALGVSPPPKAPMGGTWPILALLLGTAILVRPTRRPRTRK